MPAILDNIIAYRILSMLVKPFPETDAYKLGIIDDQGNNLIKVRDLTTQEQKDAYSYLHRLVFNLKKILNKLPGGDTKLKNLVAAFFLVREAYQTRSTVIREDQFRKLIDLQENGYILVEEQMIVDRFLDEDGIANVTGSAVSTDTPKKLANITRRKISQEISS